MGDGDIDPNNLNAGSNANLFIDNTADQYNTEMDGFTVTMTLTIPVNAGDVNSIRIGIADVSDANYDSTLIIAGDSVQTTLVALDDTSNLFPTGSKTLDVLGNDVNGTPGHADDYADQWPECHRGQHGHPSQRADRRA